MIPTSKITLPPRPSYPTPPSPLRHTGSPLEASSPKRTRESQDEEGSQQPVPAKKQQFTELAKSFQNLAFCRIQKLSKSMAYIRHHQSMSQTMTDTYLLQLLSIPKSRMGIRYPKWSSATPKRHIDNRHQIMPSRKSTL
jgi:hypothetical protein